MSSLWDVHSCVMFYSCYPGALFSKKSAGNRFFSSACFFKSQKLRTKIKIPRQRPKNFKKCIILPRNSKKLSFRKRGLVHWSGESAGLYRRITSKNKRKFGYHLRLLPDTKDKARKCPTAPWGWAKWSARRCARWRTRCSTGAATESRTARDKKTNPWCRSWYDTAHRR